MLICLAGLLTGARAQVRPAYIGDAGVKKHFYEGFTGLYHFDFQACRQEADLLIANYPSSSWGYILAAEYHWWMIISGDARTDHGKNLIMSLEEASNRTDKLPQAEGLFCKVIAYSLRSRYEIFKGNYLKSIELLNQSSRFMKESVRQPDSYEPFLLTKGLYNYFMAEAGSRFWILNPMGILGIDVSKAKGIEYLTRLTFSNDDILATEASYFLMKIFLELEHNQANAKLYADRLAASYPENLVFQYYKCFEGEPNKPVNSVIIGKFRSMLKNSSRINLSQRAHFESVMLNMEKKKSK